MTKPIILVTGGAGYIGSHTVLELLQAGYDVVAVDNLSNSSEESLKRVSALTGKAFPFYVLDILDAQGMDEVFAAHNIDVVIHFAGGTHAVCEGSGHIHCPVRSLIYESKAAKEAKVALSGI